MEGSTICRCCRCAYIISLIHVPTVIIIIHYLLGPRLYLIVDGINNLLSASLHCKD